MAPKRNRQKNSLDCCEATKRHTGSDSESVDVPLSEKGERLSFDQNMVDAEVPSGDKKRSSSNGLGKKDHNKNLVTGRKSKQRSGKVATGEKVMDRSLNSAESIEKSTRDAARSNILSDASDCREDDTSLCSEHKARICKRSIHGCLSVENVMGYCTTSVTVIERSLRSLAAFISQAVNGWIEQQKPSVMNLTAGVLNARDYVHARVKHLSPIMWAWMLQFGKLMILLSMIWLDCNIRGFDSLLRLGTSTFFVIIWCTILSIAAMVGISKLLIIMVIAALLGLFVGFAMSMLLAGICSIVILWLYGSFWTTGLVILLGGIMFALSRDRIALMISMLYAMYCARSYVGWLGLLFGLNLSFISGDVLLYLLKNNLNEHGSNTPSDHAGQNQGRGGHFYGEHSHSSTDDAFHSASVRYTERSPGDPSTSGAEEELTSENEVARLLNCNNHYSALGLARYENVDVSILKREYRKKAMLVHPDKNMGNEKAEEAFKKLQNAYEVLIDSLKRKTYDDELRREELLNYFRRFNDTLQKKGRHGFFSSGSTYYEAEGEGSHGELRRIACKKCNNFHIWTRVERSKSQARWCQDCKDFHQAKDGDGWLEQSSHSILFGLLLKREVPCAYVCAESRIYDATEWFICQGMRCPANTHRPSFHVNMSAMSKQNGGKGPSSSHGHRGAGGTSMDDAAVTEEEFFEWFQNVVQSGFFEGDDNNAQSNESPSPKAAAANSSSSKGCNNNSNTNSIKKKKRGKKQR